MNSQQVNTKNDLFYLSIQERKASETMGKTADGSEQPCELFIFPTSKIHLGGSVGDKYLQLLQTENRFFPQVIWIQFLIYLIQLTCQVFQQMESQMPS